ncbi:MAG: metal ABC transporter solute-binding protein, Zn/Mn family, partial [Actinomycetota bacterium]
TNGIGYDTWAAKMVAANPRRDRLVLDVGKLVGVPDGGNPHQWYSPSSVSKVIDEITQTYKRRDPQDAAYFDAQRTRFTTVALKAYRDAIARIKARFTGTRIGASESIFALMAPALGLDLSTPPAFLRAISEGTDPTAANEATIDRQISQHEIAVYVYNSQNATPDIQRQIDACRREDIPVTQITETLVPPGSTFQRWQVDQLTALENALESARQP